MVPFISHHHLPVRAATTLAALFLSQASVRATIGDISHPLTNGDVPATMNGGTTSAAFYYLITGDISFSSYTVSVGTSGAQNILNIQEGGRITGSLNSQIGQGVSGSPALGGDNQATVQDDGEWHTSGIFTVGELGQGNSLEILGGGLVTAGEFHIGWGDETDATGKGYGNGNNVVVADYGSELTSVGFISIGRSSNSNSLELNYGAKASCSALYVGWGDSSISTFGNSNFVILRSSVMDVADVVDLGNAGDNNQINLLGPSLLKVGTSVSVGANGGTGNHIYTDGGILAVYGNQTSALTSLVNSGAVQVHKKVGSTDSTVVATTSDVLIQYFSAAQASAAFSATGFSGLGGYTVLMSATDKPYADYVTILGATTCNQGWYNSSWYGKFYADLNWADWIWHTAHGWQYLVDAMEDGSFYVWDCGTSSFWYVNPDWYPAIYCYNTSRWYYYMSGAYPNRKFWNYTSGKQVSESSLLPPP